MFFVGSIVRTLNGDYSGTIISIYYQSTAVFVVKLDNSSKFGKGRTLHFYRKDLELIRSPIDPTSLYQYCSKCDVLTSNKPSLCCDHKHFAFINYGKIIY